MKQLGVLLACSVGGSLLSLLLRGLLPGNVLGLTLLLALLIFGAVRLHHVESVADFLLQNMAFFFLPAMLGVLEILLVWRFSALSGYKDAFAFIILIAILIFKPTGLFGETFVDKV